jgi:hypothetical protein
MFHSMPRAAAFCLLLSAVLFNGCANAGVTYTACSSTIKRPRPALDQDPVQLRPHREP